MAQLNHGVALPSVGAVDTSDDAADQAPGTRPHNGGHVDEQADEFDDYGSNFAELLDFLRHEKGAELAEKVIGLVEGLRKATVDARAAERTLQLEIKKIEVQRDQDTQARWAALSKLHLNWRSCVQTVGLIGVVGGIVYLSANQALEPAAGTILGAVAGYLFGEDRKIHPPR